MSQPRYLIPPYEGEHDVEKIREYVDRQRAALDYRVRDMANVVPYRTDLEAVVEIRRAIKEHDEHCYAALCLAERLLARQDAESLEISPGQVAGRVRRRTVRVMEFLRNPLSGERRTGVHVFTTERLLTFAAYVDELTAVDPPVDLREGFRFLKGAGQVIADLIPPPTFPCQSVIMLSEGDGQRLDHAYEALQHVFELLTPLASRESESAEVRD